MEEQKQKKNKKTEEKSKALFNIKQRILYASDKSTKVQ